jgi:hypothetical protein
VSGPPPPYAYWPPPPPPPRRRTHYGLILGLIGVLIAIVMLAWPISYSVLGTTIDCGSGLTAWNDSPSDDSADAQDLADQCQTEGRQRLLIVVLIVAASSAIGFGVTLAERQEPRRR